MSRYIHKGLQGVIAREIDDHAHLGIDPLCRAQLREAITLAVQRWLSEHPDDALDLAIQP